MTTKDPDQVPVLFHVTQQVETTTIDQNGRVARVMEVSFTAPDGISGSVNVPVATYSVATARQAIMDHLATLQGVAGLTG